MAFLSSFSSKILSTLVLGVVGSGAITGAVIATRNKEVINSAKSANPVLRDVRKSQEDNTSSENLEKFKGQNSEEEQHLGKDLEANLSKEPLTSGRTVEENIQPQTPELNEEHDNQESNLETQGKEEVQEESDKGEDLQLENYSSVSEDIGESEESKNKRYDEERLREGIVLETLWIFKTGGGSSEETRSCTLLKKGESKKIPNIIKKQEDEEETGKSCDDYDAVTSQWSDEKRIDDKIEGFWVRGENQLVKELIKENWGDRDLFKISGFAEKEKTLPENISDNLEELFKKTTICSTRIFQEQNWIELSCLINSNSINQ
ncbi:hypothetical protein MSUIS_00420 [Mycoplasma suis KI3806]|uniref:Uncharacterized protein n=1 Tax=Mycoplasma suis (strain KI_3806) TaxID=708248 RepID=F0V2R3_MYCS3|nr:hypothetical protein [Mycoplasma suis]CBZ40135.1 hypothetical protein MSUIS_00420 [Mycoplasma suis KI3806]